MGLYRTLLASLACCGLIAASAAVAAQVAKPKAPAAKSTAGKKLASHTPPSAPDPPAKELFAAKRFPADGPAKAIGFYAKGCLEGAKELPIDGKTWQVMRLSRNRNWGHSNLVAFIERLAAKVPKISKWPGLLIGDMSQPRGGPLVSGHASHQVGLDVDIWFTPMPTHTLTRAEREDMSARSVVAENRKDVNAKIWTTDYAGVIKAAAQDPAVERIFVNPAIKYEFCKEAGKDRGWLHKVRPYWGHDDHFHVRLYCPAGHIECTGQPPPSDSDGCSAADFKYWFSDAVLHPKKKPTPPKREMKLSALPAACRQVLAAP